MTRLALILLALLAALPAPAAAECPAITRQSRLRALHTAVWAGAMLGEDRDLEQELALWIADLQAMSVDWVGFSVSMFQLHGRDPGLFTDPAHGTWEQAELAAVIAALAEHGIHSYLTLAFEVSAVPPGDVLGAVYRGDLGNPALPWEWDAEGNSLSDAQRYWTEETWPWSARYRDDTIDCPSGQSDSRCWQDLFWESYAEVAERWAAFAEENGVCLFSFGTETEHLFHQNYLYPDQPGRPGLLDLVVRVREKYRGPVTYDMLYSAQFEEESGGAGGDPQSVIDTLDLDVAGVSAYYPLTDDLWPAFFSPDTIDALSREYEPEYATWVPYVTARFRDFLAPLGRRPDGSERPVVFLEFGYSDSTQAPLFPQFQMYTTRPESCGMCSGPCRCLCLWGGFDCPLEERCMRDGYPWSDRWSADPPADSDLLTQDSLIRAFFAVIDNEAGTAGMDDLVQGMFLWDHPVASRATYDATCLGEYRGMTVWNKPAEITVSRQYCRWTEGMVWDGEACVPE